MDDPTTLDRSTSDQSAAALPATPTRTLSRRGFLTGTTAAAAALAGGIGVDLAPLPATSATAAADEIGPLLGVARADEAKRRRDAATNFQRGIALPAHPDNDDEERYADRFASYQKALQHTDAGDIFTNEYDKLLTALRSGSNADFEALTLTGDRNLSNPQAAYAYQLEGADSHALSIPAAPTFTSAGTQGEMGELYWMALARDVNFANYGTDALIGDAVADLNRFTDTRGAKQNGQITRATIFQDVFPNNTVGPYISQFLLQPVPHGVQELVQRNRTRVAGDDRITTFTEWLRIQRGFNPSAQENFDATRRYIRNGRDLAEYVHADYPLQSSLNAALIIAAQGNTLDDVKFSPPITDNVTPYRSAQDQDGFITFGNQNLYDLISRVMSLALKAAWYQKWLVHRRLRPEEYGGRVEGTLRRGRSYPIGTELRNSQALARTFSRWGTYLLPQAFPEGSPIHPSYPSGHSTYIAAGVTMIKAFAETVQPIQNPKVPNADGTALVDYSGTTLTLLMELNKLISNIGTGRLFAGVHYRSDHHYGVRLGELVAIRALQDITRTYSESFGGFELETFNGTYVRVTPDGPVLSNTIS